MAAELLSTWFRSLYDILPIIHDPDDLELRGIVLGMPGMKVRIYGLSIPADGVRILDLAQHPVITQPGGKSLAGNIGVLNIREQKPGNIYHIEGYDRHEKSVDVDEESVPQLLASLADALQSPEKPRSLRSLQLSSVLFLLEE